MRDSTRTLLCSALLAAALAPGEGRAGVIHSVITDWRVHAEACDDGKIWFPEAPMHVAMFEAINAITPKYAPYLKPLEAAPGASVDAAAATAAHDVLQALCPDQADDLKDALDAALKAIPDRAARDASTRSAPGASSP